MVATSKSVRNTNRIQCASVFSIVSQREMMMNDQQISQNAIKQKLCHLKL